MLINVHSLVGMILIEGFLWSPLAFLMLAATFRVSNPDFEEAARMSGASVWDTIRRVTVKLARPAILALAMLVFVRALEGFEVPALVGLPGSINVVTTDIYLSLKNTVPPNVGRASVFSVVLLVIVAILLVFYNRLNKRAESFYTVTGKNYRVRPFDLGRGRWIASGVIIFDFLFLLVLPNLMLLWESLMPFLQPITWHGLSLLTFEHYRAVLSSRHYLQLVWNTLFLAVASATVVMCLTLLIGWLVTRKRPGAWVLDQMATMPLVFAGIVLGNAVMQVWLKVPAPIYGTIWILLIAFVTLCLPYGMRYSYAGMLQIHPELEEAAGVVGAGTFVVLRRIIVPLLMPTIASGWLFTFLLVARELSLPILLAGPDTQTISVAIFDTLSNGQVGEVAALGLLWAVLMSFVAGGLYFFSRRSGAGMFSS